MTLILVCIFPNNQLLDGIINAANKAIDPLEHRNAIFALQAKIYKDQPYVFMYSPKRKLVAHKRFDKTDFFYEKPGFILNNFLLKEEYKNMAPMP